MPFTHWWYPIEYLGEQYWKSSKSSIQKHACSAFTVNGPRPWLVVVCHGEWCMFLEDDTIRDNNNDGSGGGDDDDDNRKDHQRNRDSSSSTSSSSSHSHSQPAAAAAASQGGS